MVQEIRRGIWETTGLYSEPGAAGWITVTCESRAMADWLGAAIASENVEAQVEDDRILLPAGPRFRLENEVKSIITVVAKTHHYGTRHGGIVARAAGRDDATSRYAFRCGSCGVGFHVSRPEAMADLAATCPVDGIPMVRQELVPAGRGVSFWHAHGPGQPYHAHTPDRPEGGARAGNGSPRPIRIGVGGPSEARTALIDALRRRYGRRRAVVVTADRALEVDDPVVDLVLVESTGDGRVPAFAPATVDATLGVFSASAVADALDRGDPGLEGWHLLVVSPGGEARLDLSRFEEDLRRRHGRDPVALVDLAVAGEVDVIVAWLRREFLLEEWRVRGDRVGDGRREPR
jgi:Ni2+-binding GTPase involved in maturation of urease and hydrogenase